MWFHEFLQKMFQQIPITSVSSHFMQFILKICQTVAGTGMTGQFHKFLKSNFYRFFPFGPTKYWRHGLVRKASSHHLGFASFNLHVPGHQSEQGRRKRGWGGPPPPTIFVWNLNQVGLLALTLFQSWGIYFPPFPPPLRIFRLTYGHQSLARSLAQSKW